MRRVSYSNVRASAPASVTILASLALAFLAFLACGEERARHATPATPPAPPWGGLETRVLGDGDGPVFVWLQGYGAPAYDLVPLAERVRLPAGARSVVPVAPLAVGDGRGWWRLPPLAARERQTAEDERAFLEEASRGLPQARATVLALVEDARRRLSVETSRVVIVGFSQGAILAVDVALHLDEPPAAVVVLSGTLLAEDEWAPRMRARPGMRVFIAHGREDPLLPFAGAERLRDAFVRSGTSPTFVAFDGPHTIAPEVVTALDAFIAETFPLATGRVAPH